MTEAEVKKIVKETMASELPAAIEAAMEKLNPTYKDLKDVPAYWQAAVSALLRTGAINGGTPAEVNPTDLNIRLDTLKAAIIAAAYAERLMDANKQPAPHIQEEDQAE